MSGNLLTIKQPVVPVDLEMSRLLSLWSSEKTKEYLETRVYKDNKEAVAAFYDGLAFAGLVLGASPNKIYNALITEDNKVEFTDKVD